MGTAELVAAVRFRSVRMSHTHRANDLAVGLLGWSRRGQDAEELWWSSSRIAGSGSEGEPSMSRDTREKRDLHALTEEGTVLCNPRDREAAHRAEMEGIATDDPAAVTCRKCQELLYKLLREQRRQ
jgi:hypothetical protein